MTSTSSFWGLKLEGNLKYSKACISEPFRVTAASLDASSVASDKVVSVCFKGDDDQEFIIANLSPSHNILQVPLNLRFAPGDNISFYLKGLNGKAGCVYLSGFNIVESFEPLYIDSEDESLLEDGTENTSFIGPKRKRSVAEVATPSDSVKKSKRIKVDGKSEFIKENSSEIKSESKQNKTPKKLNKSINSDKEASTKTDSPPKSAKKSKKKQKMNESTEFNIKDLVTADKDIESDDESDEDFMMDGIQVDENGEEDSSSWEDEEVGEEDDGYLEDEEDDDDDDEEVEDDDDDDDDDDEEEDDDDSDDEETESPPKKKTEGTPSSAGRTPMAKKEKRQQDTPMPSMTKQNKSKTPKSDDGKTPQTPKSSKKNKENNQNEVNGSTNKLSKTPQPKSPKQIKAGGLICEDLKVGSGGEAKAGKMVGVYYVGKLKSGGKTFDKHLSGTPFKFRLGSQEVIQGWDSGVQGMKIGGKRRLTCPPALAYGKKGMPPDIPANSVLVFDVELKSVN